MARRGRSLSLTDDLVALVHRTEADPGPRPGAIDMTDADYAATASDLLKGHEGPLWLFAYGSLLWKPDFDHVEQSIGKAYGWRRSFCLDLTRWRGTPSQPGLMMALDTGGSCTGVAYRLPDSDDHAQMVRLLKREMSDKRNLSVIRWISVDDGARRHRALTFWAMPRTTAYYIKLPIEEQARRLACAAGHVGSCAEYLHKTVQTLHGLGIHDTYLWRLQHLVAEEIKRMQTAKDKGASR